MRSMPRTLRALLLLACTTACSCDAPTKPAGDAPPAKQPTTAAKPGPTKPEPAKSDPILLKVCKAFDEVKAEGKAEMLMARTAVRSTELGVDEAQLEALGSQPTQLLASIRARG